MSKKNKTPENGATKPTFKEKLKKLNSENNTKWQAFKYLCCTASAGLIQFITFTILQAVLPQMGTMRFIVEDMDKATFIATTVGLALSVLWNFTLNRKFTFKAANNVPLAMFLAFLFYVPFYPFQTWYVHTVKSALNNTDAAGILAEATVMIINGVLEFCWQKFVIYRKSANTAGKKEDKTESDITKEDDIKVANAELEKIDASIDDVKVEETDTITKG